MGVDECIQAYVAMSDGIFTKNRLLPANMRGQVHGRFSTAELERAVKSIIKGRMLEEDALLMDPDAHCKV